MSRTRNGSQLWGCHYVILWVLISSRSWLVRVTSQYQEHLSPLSGLLTSIDKYQKVLFVHILRARSLERAHTSPLSKQIGPYHDRKQCPFCYYPWHSVLQRATHRTKSLFGGPYELGTRWCSFLPLGSPPWGKRTPNAEIDPIHRPE